MTTTLFIAASGLLHQQQRLQAAAHNTANAAAALSSATTSLGELAVEAEGGGVESLTHTAPGGGLLSTGILPMLTAPNHARGLAQVIQTQDEMTGILLDMTA